MESPTYMATHITVIYSILTISSEQSVIGMSQSVNRIQTLLLSFYMVGAICNLALQKRCIMFLYSFAYSHSSVKGLFVWCQVCGHGGHLQHMQDWLKKNRKCPAGCGHECTWYTILDLHWTL